MDVEDGLLQEVTLREMPWGRRDADSVVVVRVLLVARRADKTELLVQGLWAPVELAGDDARFPDAMGDVMLAQVWGKDEEGFFAGCKPGDVLVWKNPALGACVRA